MDRLDRRGGLFLDWASAAFGGGEQRRSGELPEDSSSSADRSISSAAARHVCLCRDRKKEIGGEVPTSARPDRPPSGFADAHFPPPIGSHVRAIKPFSWPAPLVLLPSLGAIGGIGLQGLSSLDCLSWR